MLAVKGSSRSGHYGFPEEVFEDDRIVRMRRERRCGAIRKKTSAPFHWRILIAVRSNASEESGEMKHRVRGVIHFGTYSGNK